MTVETITTTGRGLSPNKTTNINRRADAILDYGEERLLVLLWNGLWQRNGDGVAWHKQLATPTYEGNTVQPAAPTKRIRLHTDVIEYMPNITDDIIVLRYGSDTVTEQRDFWRDRSTPSGYLGFTTLTQANIEHDWLIFRGLRKATAGIGCAQDEAVTSWLHEYITDRKYMVAYRPSGNQLTVASGTQSVQLSNSVTAESRYDMCSAVVGSSRYYIAAIETNEVRLWSVRPSLASTDYGAVTVPSGLPTSQKLLLCAFPTGDLGACIIGYRTSGRPDVFVASFDSENEVWSSWIRINNDTDWGSVQPANWVAWCRYPSIDKFRLVMTRGNGGNNTTRIYELPSTFNRAPTAPNWTSPESGSAHARTLPLTMEWQFNDADPGDAQSAYTVRRITNAGTRYRTATGWQAADDGASKLIGPATSLTLTSPWASAGDGTHRYQVRTWDNADTVSPWSLSLAINHGDPHNPTITSPTANESVDQRVDVTWLSNSQSAYRIELREGATTSGALVYDTGELVSNDRLHTLTMDATGVTRTIVLCTWSSAGIMSALRSVTVTTSFTLPLLPTVTLTPLDSDSLIRVEVTQATIPSGSQAPTVEEWKVERREHDDNDTAITVAAGLPADTTSYNDRTPQHQADYDYRVTVTGDDRSNTTGWQT